MRFGYNNPVFKKALKQDYAYDGTVASYKGVASKLIFYIAMTFLGAALGLFLMKTNPTLFSILLVVSLFSTFFFALIAMASPSSSKVMGTIYCLGEGMLIGVVSAEADLIAPGSVVAAVLGTLVVLMVVATLYMTGVVKVNSKFVAFLYTFAISILISYVLILILNFTIYDGSINIGLGFLISGIMIFLITLYLFFNIEQVRQVVESGAPKVYEWYLAFGLAFLVLWLYMEILPIVIRLIADRK